VTKATVSRSYFGGMNNDGLHMFLQGQRRDKPYEVEYFMHNLPFLECVCGFYCFYQDLNPWPRMLPIQWVVILWLVLTSQCWRDTFYIWNFYLTRKTYTRPESGSCWLAPMLSIIMFSIFPYCPRKLFCLSTCVNG
jgi:hypothetical protein